MSSTFCVVMRIGVNVGVNNGCTTDNVRMRKNRYGSIIGYKEHCQ